MLLFSILSCVLRSPLEYTPCESAHQCQAAFGSVYTCGEENLCEVIPPNNRCLQTYPTDFWDNPSLFNGAFILPQMFDSTADSGKIIASQLAIQDIVEAGDDSVWENNPLVHIQCDISSDNNLSDKEVVQEVTDYLVDTIGTSIIIGPATSQNTQDALDSADGNSVIISPSATANHLKENDGTAHTDEDPGLFWRTTAPDSFQSSILHLALIEEDPSQVAIIYQNDNYGAGIAFSLANTLASENPHISVVNETFESNQTVSISTLINSVFADSFTDAVVFISSEPEYIINAIDAMGFYSEVPLFLTDAAAKEEVLLGLQNLTQGNEDVESRILNQVSGTKPALPDTPLFDNFASRMNSVQQDSAINNVFAAHTYDATWLAAISILWAHAEGELHSPQAYGRALRSVSKMDESEISLEPRFWNGLYDNIISNSPMNITGTSGNLDFNELTEELKTGIDIWSFEENFDGFLVTRTCQSSDCSE